MLLGSLCCAHRYDANRNGQLEFEEFKRLVADLRAFQGQDRVTRVFQRFDRDKSGSIDVRELAGALFHLEIGSDDYRTAAILKRYATASQSRDLGGCVTL